MKLGTILGYAAVGIVGVWAGRWWMSNQTIAATGNTVTLPSWANPALVPTPISYQQVGSSTAVTASS